MTTILAVGVYVDTGSIGSLPVEDHGAALALPGPGSASLLHPVTLSVVVGYARLTDIDRSCRAVAVFQLFHAGSAAAAAQKELVGDIRHCFKVVKLEV